MENQLERQTYEERATAGNPDDLTIEIVLLFFSCQPPVGLLWYRTGRQGSQGGVNGPPENWNNNILIGASNGLFYYEPEI